MLPGSEGDMTRAAGPRAGHDGAEDRLPGDHRPAGQRPPGLVRGGFADVSQRGLTVLAERALPEEEITQEVLDHEILQAEMAYDATLDDAAKHAAEAAIAQLREARAALVLSGQAEDGAPRVIHTLFVILGRAREMID